MKKILFLLLVMFTMSGCGNESQSQAPAADTKPETSAQAATANKKVAVVYFSRTGEEYGVGNISKGNTAIVAEFIAKKTGADTFEIKAATPYPNEYDACTELAKRELETNARPAIVSNIDNLAQYDTIFIGYPIWWSALPRVMMTFLESNDLSGKTIIPFCTHGGSGLASTERELKTACPNSKVLDGVAIVGKRCQNNPDDVRAEVNQWLQGLGY